MRSHPALGSGARTVTLLLVLAIGMTSSGLPAAARVYTEKDFLAYKERLQKRYDVALNSLQKDLRGQNSKLEAQHKLVGQPEMASMTEKPLLAMPLAIRSVSIFAWNEVPRAT